MNLIPLRTNYHTNKYVRLAVLLISIHLYVIQLNEYVELSVGGGYRPIILYNEGQGYLNWKITYIKHKFA